MQAQMVTSDDRRISEGQTQKMKLLHSVKFNEINIRELKIDLFRDLIERVPWEGALEGRGVQERLIVKDNFF